MSKFAIIKNGLVANIVIAESSDLVHPDGGTVVPVGPHAEVGGCATIDGETVTFTPKSQNSVVPTVEDVRIEARRRITILYPEWYQNNLNAMANQLLKKGLENWSADDTAEWNAVQTVWNTIDTLRAKSNTLEDMEEIPVDFRDDQYWT